MLWTNKASALRSTEANPRLNLLNPQRAAGGGGGRKKERTEGKDTQEEEKEEEEKKEEVELHSKMN